jgi:hypothetical protein
VCDRWHTGFVDAAGTGGLLAQVEGRTSAATIAWLNAQPATWRAGITHVTIDLSASYAKAVRDALPGAVPVADRFHLVALANGMLTQVRQRVIREAHDRRGRKTGPAWAARRRLLTGYERLRPETFAKMWNSLIDTGDEGMQILQAYVGGAQSRACVGRDQPRTPRHPNPAGQLLPTCRPDRRTRGTPPGRHHRSVVASHRSRHSDGVFELQVGGLQPSSETPRPQCLWVPQSSQPTTTNTLRMYSPTPASLSHEQHIARSSSMSPFTQQQLTAGPLKTTEAGRTSVSLLEPSRR